MTELNKEEINLINNMAESYWQENNRNHIDNKEEWDLTLNLIKKLTIPVVVGTLFCDDCQKWVEKECGCGNKDLKYDETY